MIRRTGRTPDDEHRNTISTRNAIQRAFDQFGRESGFEKKSGSWYRRGDEVVAVSNLQKSQYGPSYYINQGFWLSRLGAERYPKVNKCHIQARIEDLLPTAEFRLGQLLTLDFDVPAEQRSKELVDLLERALLPLIK